MITFKSHTGSTLSIGVRGVGERYVRLRIDNCPDIDGGLIEFTLTPAESRRLVQYLRPVDEWAGLQNIPPRLNHNPICETAETGPRHALSG